MQIKEEFIWHRLRAETRPIVLYGTGNGAEKILKTAEKYGVKISDVFASSGFVRERSFMGYTVKSAEALLSELENPICLLGFAVDEKYIEDISAVGARFSEFLVPEVPVFGEEIFSPELFDAARDKIDELYCSLEDEQSRRVLSGLISYKLSGKPRYIREIETDRSEIFSRIFPKREGEIFYDLGAYIGDTVEEFIKHSDNYERIIALEPAPKNFERLSLFVKENNIRNISLIPAAASGNRGVAFFSEKGGRNPYIKAEGKIKVDMLTLPQIAELTGFEPTFIKMDIEGLEGEALMGARELISKNAPRLSISLYHKLMDFLEIPLYIKSLNPEYKLYLRHHPYLPAWETNLYAKIT